MILLPAPQSVRIDDGGHQLRPGRRIHVAGGLMPSPTSGIARR